MLHNFYCIVLASRHENFPFESTFWIAKCGVILCSSHAHFIVSWSAPSNDDRDTPRPLAIRTIMAIVGVFSLLSIFEIIARLPLQYLHSFRFRIT